MGGKYFAGIDLGTTCGLSKLFYDGTCTRETFKLETEHGDRLEGLERVVYAAGSSPDCQMVVFENPFGMNRNACKVLDMMLGAAVLVCEQRNIPWAMVNVGTIKKHLAGKGNATKPMMIAAAKARWGGEFTEHEADAAGAAAVFLDAQ